jgi:hypothetical protein
LFAALGLARTEQLKTLISVMGACTSLAWLYAVGAWPDLAWREIISAGGLAGVFLAAWVVSSIAHATLWSSGKDEPTVQNVVVTMKQP